MSCACVPISTLWVEHKNRNHKRAPRVTIILLSEIRPLRYPTDSPHQPSGHRHEKQDGGKSSGCLAMPAAAAGSGRGGCCGLPPHGGLCCPGPCLPITTPLLCAPACRRLGGESRTCAVGLFPSLPCRQYSAVLKEGLGSLLFFPGFLLAHEKKKKKKNNEEPVLLRLAKPWADGDVTPSPAVTGCSQTGHALSRHGAATGHRPPHTSAPAAATQRLGGERGEHTRANKAPAKHEAEGDVPLGGMEMAPSPRSSATSWLRPGRPPGAVERRMGIIISWWNGVLWNWGWRGK